MADEISVNADFSTLVEQVLAATKGFDGFDITANQVTQIVTSLSGGLDTLEVKMNAVANNGDLITATFKTLTEDMIATSLNANAVVGGLELVTQSFKKVNEVPIDSNRVESLKAIAQAARDAITLSAGANNPVVETNAFQNQLEAITRAAINFKGPLEDARNLIGATAEQAASAEGSVRQFADAIFKATQSAGKTNVVDFADKLKQTTTQPQTLSIEQAAALTASEREVGDAAVKAGLDMATFNAVLGNSTEFLANIKGSMFEVAQAIVAYREQINQLANDQQAQAEKAAQVTGAQKATSFAKTEIIGPGNLSGTNDEIAKQVSALASFQKEAEKSGLSFTELQKVVENFKNGITNTDTALSGLNAALVNVQNASKNSGNAQRQAAIEDQKRAQAATEIANSLNQAALAAAEVAKIKVQFPIPSSADVELINKFSANLGFLQTTIANSSVNAAELSRILSSSVNGTGEVFTGEGNKIQKAFNAVITSANEAKESVSNFSQDAIDFLSRVGSQVTTILINQLYHAFVQNIDASIAFDRQITQSLTTTAAAGASYDELAKKVTELSNTFGIARGDTAAGLFQTLKHGIGDVAQSEAFLAEAAKFAKDTNSSLVDSVNVGTSALNSFNLSADQSTRVFATLAQAVKTGRLTVQELSTTLGTVGVIGSQVGISFEETTAALETLSASGIRTQQATTFLRNLFGQLISPTKDMNALLHENGFASGGAAGETLHLAGVLQLVQNAANGNIATTGELVKNLRGLQAELGLSGEKFTVFIDNLKKTGDASLAYGETTKKVFASNAQVYDEFKQRLLNTFNSDAITNFIGGIIKAFGGAENALHALEAALIGLSFGAAIATVGALTFALGGLSAALLTVNISLKALVASFVSSFGLPAVIVGALVAGVAYYVLSLDDAKTATEKGYSGILAAQKKLSADTNAVFQAQADTLTQQVNLQVQNIERIYSQLSVSVSEHLTEASKALRIAVDSDVKAADSALAELKKNQTEAQNQSLAIDKAIGSEKLKNQELIFEEQQRGLTLASEISNRQQEANNLEQQGIQQVAAASAEAQAGRLKEAAILEGLSKQSFADASKQLDKVAQLRLKQEQLANGYSAALVDVLKKEFDLEVKLVGEGEKKVLDTFKRIKDAEKDITDKNGDASGDSFKFLNDQVKQLSSYLNELKGLNGRVRVTGVNATPVDPGLRELLDATDPKTIRKLKVAIQNNDKETTTRILGDLTTIKKTQDQIAIAKEAYDTEAVFRQRAIAARQNNDFEAERKNLAEVAAFAVKSQADGFRSGNNVRADLKDIEARILQTYIDEGTVLGVKKQREDDIFNTGQKQLELEKEQQRLLGEQIDGQLKLKETLDLQAKAAEEAHQRDTERLNQAKLVFEQLNAIKPEKNGIVTAEDVKRAQDLVTELTKTTGSKFDLLNTEDFQTSIKAALEKQTALEDAFRVQKTQKDLESARASVNAQIKERLAAEKQVEADLQSVILAVSDDTATKAAQQRLKVAKEVLAELQSHTGPDLPGSRATTPNQLASAQKQVDLAQEQLDLERKHREELNGSIPLYTDIIQQLKEGKTISDAQLEQFNLNGILAVDNLKTGLDEVEAVAERLGLSLKKKVELDTNDAKDALTVLKNSVLDLETHFKFDLTPLQTPPTQVPEQAHFHGGIVYGPSGIDAIPARLTAGETVIDAKNSSRFFNQLAQIRSGNPPTSTSSSVNFGGVNINLNSSGNAKVDARELAREFKRLQSRGVI
jgi:TP901 family phage tail tape measure protein